MTTPKTTTPKTTRRSQWIVIAISATTAILASIALVISVGTNATNIRRANEERIQARYSNCVLLRRIVLVAAPPDRQGRALAFLARTPLANCDKYSTTTQP